MRYAKAVLGFTVLSAFVACQNEAPASADTPVTDAPFAATANALNPLLVECVPRKAYAFPGDQILMRGSVRFSTTDKTVSWTNTGGTLDSSTLIFTAPSESGTVSLTATSNEDGKTSSTCTIEVVQRRETTPTGPGSELSANTALGLPGPADQDPRHYLLKKDEYVVSYNSVLKTPNWVAWQLNSTHLGGATRTNEWMTDASLPADVPQAIDTDYRKSGWDRGHMCPSADRTRLREQNAVTFTFTNALPQASNVNSGPWLRLEMYLQNLAFNGAEIFVVAGGLFDAAPPTIGEGKVSVPSATWKVAVILEHLGDRSGQVTTSTRVIAVIMPNDDAAVGREDEWEPHRVRVDDVEALTGLDFLSEVAPGIQDSIESHVDGQSELF